MWLLAGAGWSLVPGRMALVAPWGRGAGGATEGCSLLPLPDELCAVWFGIQGSGEMPQFGPWLFFCLWVTSGALLRVPRKRP